MKSLQMHIMPVLLKDDKEDDLAVLVADFSSRRRNWTEDLYCQYEKLLHELDYQLEGF